MKKIYFIVLFFLLTFSVPHITQAAMLDCANEEIIGDIKVTDVKCEGECKDYTITSRNLNFVNNSTKQAAQTILNKCETSDCTTVEVGYFPVCLDINQVYLFISKINKNTTSSAEAQTISINLPLKEQTIPVERKFDQNAFSFEIDIVPKSGFVRAVNYIKREPELVVMSGIGVLIINLISFSFLRKRVKTSDSII